MSTTDDNTVSSSCTGSNENPTSDNNHHYYSCANSELTLLPTSANNNLSQNGNKRGRGHNRTLSTPSYHQCQGNNGDDPTSPTNPYQCGGAIDCSLDVLNNGHNGPYLPRSHSSLALSSNSQHLDFFNIPVSDQDSAQSSSTMIKLGSNNSSEELVSDSDNEVTPMDPQDHAGAAKVTSTLDNFTAAVEKLEEEERSHSPADLVNCSSALNSPYYSPPTAIRNSIENLAELLLMCGNNGHDHDDEDLLIVTDDEENNIGSENGQKEEYDDEQDTFTEGYESDRPMVRASMKKLKPVHMMPSCSSNSSSNNNHVSYAVASTSTSFCGAPVVTEDRDKSDELSDEICTSVVGFATTLNSPVTNRIIVTSLMGALSDSGGLNNHNNGATTSITMNSNENSSQQENNHNSHVVAEIVSVENNSDADEILSISVDNNGTTNIVETVSDGDYRRGLELSEEIRA